MKTEKAKPVNISITGDTDAISRSGTRSKETTPLLNDPRSRKRATSKAEKWDGVPMSPAVERMLDDSGRLYTPRTIYTPKMSPSMGSDGMYEGGEHSKWTVSQTAINFASYMMGMVFLVYPYTCAYLGWIGFTGCFLLTSVLAFYTGRCLITVMDACDNPTFGGLSLKLLGSTGAGFVVAFQYIELFFYAVGILIQSGDNLAHLVGTENLSTFWGRIIAFVIVVPTLLVDDARIFSGMQSIGLALMLSVVAIFVVGEFINTPHSPIHPQENFKLFDSSVIFLGHGVILMGFSAHCALPELRGKMLKPQKFKQVYSWVMLLMIASFTLTTICAVLTFGLETRDQLTFNFEGAHPIIGILVQAFITANGLLRVCICILPISLFIEQLFQRQHGRKWWFWKGVYMFRITIAALALYVGFVLGSLDTVLGFVGLVCASFFIYVCCVLMFNVADKQGLVKSSTGRYYFNWALIVWGVVSSLLGLYQLFFADMRPEFLLRPQIGPDAFPKAGL